MTDFELAEETAQDGLEESSTSTDTTGAEPAEGVTTGDSPTTEPVAQENAVTTEDPAASKGAQDRIRQLVAKQHEAEREAAYWQGIAEAKKTEGKPPEEKAQPNLAVKPNRNSFEDYDDYVDALTDYKIEQRRIADEQRIRTESEAAKAAEKETGWARQVAEVSKAMPDFQEVVLNNRTLAISPVMADAMKESEKGAEVAYWLGKNPEEAARIARLTPFAAVREIGRIEEKLASVKAAPVEPKRISNASEPITPLAGKSDAQKDPSKMSDDEWFAWDKARRAEKYAKK